MGFSEAFDVDGLRESLLDVYHKQSLFYRNLREHAEEEFGTSALPALRAGLQDYGRWRAEVNQIQPSVVVSGQDPTSWVANWECADFAMFAEDSSYRADDLEASPGQVAVSMANPPEWEYFERLGQGAWLEDFWSWVMDGVTAGYERLVVSPGRDDEGRWRLALAGDGLDVAGAGLAEPSAVLRNPERAVSLIRQSSVHNGALYFFIARALIAAFDASGEACVRRGVRAIGRERGLALRERHLALGLPLNMQTLMTDWDGPLVSVWQWRDEGSLNPLSWAQDCVWCPYAAAWSQFGNEGQRLGYLYDLELHTTMYNAYLPGVSVRWEKLKTRGDAVCGFRFTVDADAVERANAAVASQ